MVPSASRCPSGSFPRFLHSVRGTGFPMYFSHVINILLLAVALLAFPIQNLPASSLDALARRSYFSSTLTHAPGSLCRLRLLSVLYFSRTCVLCSDLCWVALNWPVIRYSATNSIVFAQYTLSFFDLPITDLSQTVLAVGVATFSVAGRSFKTTVPTRSSLDFSCCHLH